MKTITVKNINGSGDLCDCLNVRLPASLSACFPLDLCACLTVSLVDSLPKTVIPWLTIGIMADCTCRQQLLLGWLTDWLMPQPTTHWLILTCRPKSMADCFLVCFTDQLTYLLNCCLTGWLMDKLYYRIIILIPSSGKHWAKNNWPLPKLWHKQIPKPELPVCTQQVIMANGYG